MDVLAQRSRLQALNLQSTHHRSSVTIAPVKMVEIQIETSDGKQMERLISCGSAPGCGVDLERCLQGCQKGCLSRVTNMIEMWKG